jgi:hypothetical protein
MQNLTLALLFIIANVAHGVTFTYGSYSGNGTSQSITGVGFQPDIVLIKSDGAYAAVVATSSMTAGDAKLLTGTAALATNHISTLDADGFTVGSSNQANKSAQSYYFVAWDDDSGIDIGSYVGSPGSVTVGYRPAMVWILGDDGVWPDYASYAFDGHGGASSRFQDGNTTEDHIGSFTATGFNVGADLDNVGETYHYVTFKDDDDVTESSYVGDNSSGFEVTAPATDIQFVMTKSSLNENGWFKSRNMPDGISSKFSGTAPTTNSIKDWSADGFAFGTNSEVNGSGKTHYYYASKGGGVLPVELLSFKANLEGKAVKVEWETASEINSSHFLVERSFDGINFEIIGEVAAAGESSETIAYEYFDYAPGTENNYYRLKQIDYDDAFEYFNTVVVNGTTGTEMTHVNLYPNPVLDDANFYFDSREGGPYRAQIYNSIGVEVYSATMFATEGGNNLKVDVMLYDPGYYIATLTGPDGAKKQMKFYKRL